MESIGSYNQLFDLVYGNANGISLTKAWNIYISKQKLKVPSDILKDLVLPFPPQMVKKHIHLYFPRLSYERLMRLVGDYISVRTPQSCPVELVLVPGSKLDTFRAFEFYFKYIQDSRPPYYSVEIPRPHDYNPNWPQYTKLDASYSDDLCLKELILAEVLYTQLGLPPLIPFQSYVICLGTKVFIKKKVFSPVVMSSRDNVARGKNIIEVFWIDEQVIKRELSTRKNFFPLTVNVRKR